MMWRMLLLTPAPYQAGQSNPQQHEGARLGNLSSSTVPADYVKGREVHGIKGVRLILSRECIERIIGYRSEEVPRVATVRKEAVEIYQVRHAVVDREIPPAAIAQGVGVRAAEIEEVVRIDGTRYVATIAVQLNAAHDFGDFMLGHADEVESSGTGVREIERLAVAERDRAIGKRVIGRTSTQRLGLGEGVQVLSVSKGISRLKDAAAGSYRRRAIGAGVRRLIGDQGGSHLGIGGGNHELQRGAARTQPGVSKLDVEPDRDRIGERRLEIVDRGLKRRLRCGAERTNVSWHNDQRRRRHGGPRKHDRGERTKRKAGKSASSLHGLPPELIASKAKFTRRDQAKQISDQTHMAH